MKKIIVAYIPALHEGYIKFLRNYYGLSLYLIKSEDLSKENDYYSRDVRAIDCFLMKKIISTLGMMSEVGVINPKMCEVINSLDLQIVMPDEDISRDFAQLYFSGIKVTFESVFLRWDKKISQKEFEVSPDRIISSKKLDRDFMTGASSNAGKSSDWWRQVGAVAVKDGKVIFSGFNQHLPNDQNNNVLGDPRSNFNAGEHIDLCSAIHAEASIIAQAAKYGSPLEGASIYVTVFPCPVCAKSIALAGIKKVYYSQGYSLLDAEEIFKAFKIEVILVKDEV